MEELKIQPNGYTQGIGTRCIHADHGVSYGMNAHISPLYQTSTFVFDSADHGADAFAGKNKAHIYTRLGNPTVQAFEKLIANLEEGEEGIAYASGMGALNGVCLALLSAGDHMICSNTMYGPTIHLCNNVLKKYNIENSCIDTANLEAVEKAIKPNTKLIMVETPANPTNKISDIRAIADICNKDGRNIIQCVDSTFATPIFQRPLNLGADISLHSITKYINGHGDVIGGVVVTNKQLGKIIRTWRKDCAGGLSPFDAWLAIRGARTLYIRMKAHHAIGLEVAQYLAKHPKIHNVMHPGLPDFKYHEIAKKQMTGYGSTFSFELPSFEKAKLFLSKLKLCILAVSLGKVDTLIEHPASMTHASVSKELMALQELTPELVRISVGIEDPEDVIEDLEQALAQI